MANILSDLTTVDKIIIATGDLNFHLDKATDKKSLKCNIILQYCGMKRRINEPIHVRGQSLPKMYPWLR